MDKARRLYLIAYDVSDDLRLNRVCRFLTGFKVAGQKSVFEIWATAAELSSIRAQLAQLIDPQEDRVHILSLDPRLAPQLYGKARHFSDNHFLIS
ncbi:MAG: CRISPR-associated endonuclease Cas2 [Rhodocyclaceae bacterium]|nr:CRISPR-associated endonuclease Cas2 [Rhodocyclaceae bacterium]